MTLQNATIDEAIHAFFLLQKVGASQSVVELLRSVEGQLRTCIETEAEHYLDEDDLMWVKEEQLRRPGVIARSMDAEDIFLFLAHFVEPRWQPDGVTERAIQLTQTEALAKAVANNGLSSRKEVASELKTIHAAANRATLAWRRQNAARRPDPGAGSADKTKRPSAPKGALPGSA